MPNVSPLMQKTKGEGSSPFTVCFVCTGNTCRSPMAMAYLASRRPDMTVLSAGLYAHSGHLISQNAVLALREKKIPSLPSAPYETHTAQLADEWIMAKCDLVVGITQNHAMELLCRFPTSAQKIVCMPCDITDPYGGDLDTYLSCLDGIMQGVDTLFSL